MQSRVVEFEDEGPTRHRRQDADEEQKGPVDYPERDPLDLIEEDKRPFARRKLLATCCGGCRTVFDEVTAEQVHIGLLLVQILTYIFIPGLIALFALIIWPDKDDKYLACIVVTVTLLIVCGSLHTLSFMKMKKELEENHVREQAAAGNNKFNPGVRPIDIANMADDDNESLFSKKSFFFLVPPKQSVFELGATIFMAGAFGFFATYLSHPATAEFTQPDDEGQRDLCVALSLVVVFFSSYSLISAPIPELAPYGTDDSFHFFYSHHLQRVMYVCMLGFILLLGEEGSEDSVVMWLMVPHIYWLNFICLLLQMIGWLSNPFVSFLWLAEQTEILLFGGTARASDLRILISLLVNCLFVIIFTHSDVKEDAELTIVYFIAAYITSKNYMHTFGLKKPFKVENEEMQRQKTHAHIVFSTLEGGKSEEELAREKQFCPTMTLVANVVGFLVLSTVAEVAIILFLEDDDPKQIVMDWRSDNDKQDRKDLVQTLSYVGCAIALIAFIVSSLGKKVLCRCIPCANMQIPALATQIANLLAQIIAVMLASIIVLNQTQLKWYKFAPHVGGFGEVNYLSVWEDLAIGIQVMLCLRVFKRALGSPMLFAIEVATAFIVIDALEEEEDFWRWWIHRYNFVGVLAFSQFLIHRSRVFFNKVVYIGVSFLTAFKNKKQRIRSQWICVLLQFTLLLPWFGAVLLWTTVCDVATIPTFGFAFFTAGYLKPQRAWSAISAVEANPKDQTSDGHLYNAMQSQLNLQIREMILRDPSNFEAGSFYLLKNDKMIILVQVLERSDGFVVFTSKGSELQETTVCHAEENEHINEVMKSIFDEGKIDPQPLFSLSPIRKVEFELYQDLKYSLAGMITDQEFANMTKRYFMAILAYRLAQLTKGNLHNMVRICSQDLSREDQTRCQQFINQEWLDHLGIANTTFQYNEIRAEETQAKGQVSQGMTFMDQINAQNNSRSPLGLNFGSASPSTSSAPPHSSLQRNHIEEGTTNPGARKNGRMPEDMMFEDLEQMLGAGGAAPVSKKQTDLVRRGSSSRIVPMNDLNGLDDDLEDVNQFQGKRIKKDYQQVKSSLPPKPLPPAAARSKVINAGLSDDLDDELDDNKGRREGTLPDTTFNVSPARDFSAEQDVRRVSVGTREPMNDQNTFAGSSIEPARANVQPSKKEKAGALDDLADLEDLMEGGESEAGEGNMKQFLAEAFCLVFKDEFTQFSTSMNHAYNNSVQSSVETRKFLQSNDTRALFLKNEILYAVRLAMHLSMDKFVMADFDLEQGQELEKLIESEHGKWFLGGEPFMWNSAIAKRMPQLERMITKKGQFYIHQLKFGKASDADSKFSVFEFRREVVRAIWANLNTELIYYTNANDERFSIQAEKDILRNLLVHLAEVPLGYPVYSSGAQTLYF